MTIVRHVLEKKGPDVTTIARDASVLDAAQKMNELRIGAVIVLHQDKIAGIFTERDILNRVVAARKDPAQTRIHEVMTAKVAVCSPDTTLESCRTAMTRNKLRHLPVVEGDRLIGMISIGDLLAQEIQDQEETIRWLHEYLHGPN